MKPNYRFERAERNRAKQAKKEEKSRRQQGRALLRHEDDAAGTTDEHNLPETGGSGH